MFLMILAGLARAEEPAEGADALTFRQWSSLTWTDKNKFPAYVRDDEVPLRERWQVVLDEDHQPLPAADFARRVGDTDRAAALERNDRARKTWTHFIYATSGSSLAMTTFCSLSEESCSLGVWSVDLALAGAGLVGTVPLIGSMMRRPRLAYSRDEAEHLLAQPPG